MKYLPSQLCLPHHRQGRTHQSKSTDSVFDLPCRTGRDLCRAVPRHQAERRTRAALVGHRPLLDARRDDDAGLRRHHVHERHRPHLQHRRAAVGRRVPAGDAAVPLHPAVLRAVARGAGAAARAAGSAGGHARPRHHRGVRPDRRGAHRAAGRPRTSPMSSSSPIRRAPASCSATASGCWRARTTTA